MSNNRKLTPYWSALLCGGALFGLVTAGGMANGQGPKPQTGAEAGASPEVKDADYIPVPDPVTIVSTMPITMVVPGRPVALQMRVSAPSTGSKLPVILLSHGLGHSNFLSSMHGYAPLADFYASHGFVVIQPTHIDSKTLHLPPDSPAMQTSWRSRAMDMRFILDHLNEVAAAVPGLKGRIDAGHVAAIGHSAGGHTVQLLAGMRPTDPATGKEVDLADPRIRAVVMIGAPGGDTDLGPAIAQGFPIAKKVNFTTMKTPALVIAGDQDVNPMFSPRATWRADAYPLSPGPKCMLTLFGAKHSYGGVAQYDAAETTDENPERVSILERLSWAYLRSQLYPGDAAWQVASSALSKQSKPLGQIQCK